MTKPWRKVIGTKFHPNPGYGKHWAVGGSTMLKLECGHEWPIKASRPVPKRARCHECGNLLGGGTHSRFDLRAGVVHEERMDEATGMPKRMTRTMTEDERREWTR